jgi:hypothetical protein
MGTLPHLQGGCSQGRSGASGERQSKFLLTPTSEYAFPPQVPGLASDAGVANTLEKLPALMGTPDTNDGVDKHTVLTSKVSVRLALEFL